MHKNQILINQLSLANILLNNKFTLIIRIKLIMKIHFLFFIMTSAIPKYRKLPEVVVQMETLPDYFGFDVDDFDGVILE